MNRLKILLYIIAISQIALGALTALVPGPFFIWMGLTAPPADNQYMLGMLSARFFAYGIGMIVLARASRPDRFWLLNMVLIQLIDLAAGLFYVSNGTIGWEVAAFPMFNATIFAALLWLWMPQSNTQAQTS